MAWISCNFLIQMIVAFTATIASGQSPPEKIHSTIGFPQQIIGHVISGSVVEPKPILDRDQPVIVRILETYPHGSEFRYDIEFRILDPGEFNISDSLRRIDSSDAQPIAAIPVVVDALLPAGQVEPSELKARSSNFISFYFPAMLVAGILWLAGLAMILFYGRAKKIRARAEIVPLTVAQRLRPLVESAIKGDITTEQQAELERLLASFWAEKMQWNDLTANELRQRLRTHPEASQLLDQIDHWLHRPQVDASSINVDVAKLLAPYA